MKHKKGRKTSLKRNKSFAKKKIRKDIRITERSRDGMRATRRNYGEGLAL